MCNFQNINVDNKTANAEWHVNAYVICKNIISSLFIEAVSLQNTVNPIQQLFFHIAFTHIVKAKS